MVEVTQEDRERAAELLGGATPDGLLDGSRDHLSLVQAFARHRTTALAAKEAENAELRAENTRLRLAIASIANRINVEGSPWHEAQVALDKLVAEIKREARAILERDEHEK